MFIADREYLFISLKSATIAADGIMIYSSSFYAGLRPDPPLKVSEWADKAFNDSIIRARKMENRENAVP